MAFSLSMLDLVLLRTSLIPLKGAILYFLHHSFHTCLFFIVPLRSDLFFDLPSSKIFQEKTLNEMDFVDPMMGRKF